MYQREAQAMMRRRFFIKSSGIAVAGIGLIPSFLARAAVTNAGGRKNKILIAIFQRGAADGLNMVAPFGERAYYSLRPSLAVPEPKPGSSEAAMDLKEMLAAVEFLKRANPEQYQPSAGVEYPRSPFGNSLRQIAQLIKAGVGLEVAFADLGGWDTHANQGGVNGQLANRLTDFSRGISALYTDLGDRRADVAILTMSEFGRTAAENGNRGTDHGHANAMLVLGGGVRGGKVYGDWPGLAREQLYEGRDLALTTDFRTVFAELIAGHLGNKNLKAVFPGFTVQPKQFRGLLGESGPKRRAFP